MTSSFEISSDGAESNDEHPCQVSTMRPCAVVPGIVRAPIKSLHPADSPRVSGESVEHARALAESEERFPPIIVHRASMRVIDGMHRLHAAMLRGQQDIEIQYFDGDVCDAFVLAVKANITHGLPLSLADRTAAAERIVASHPQWSDRAIASTVGLAARTVAGIRRRCTAADPSCSTAENPQLNTRIGRDGKLRPLTTTQGRRIAGELMIKHPDAPLREIASTAGISLGTAQDVRERLRHGEDPVPAPRQSNNHRKHSAKHGELTTHRAHELPIRTSTSDRISILNQLKRDPSLRLTHTGRVLLHLMHVLTIGTGEWTQLITTMPAHCRPAASSAARACADAWQEFADRLGH